MANLNEFGLSRINAAGWKAARKFLAGEEPENGAIALLNPYKNDPERSRWLTGFRDALGVLGKE
jgi:hypothetical protein